MVKITWKADLAVILAEPPPATALALVSQQEKELPTITVLYKEMHRRLMHASEHRVLKACKIAGIKAIGVNEYFYEHCTIVKAKQQISRAPQIQWKAPYQCVMIDSIEYEPMGLHSWRYACHTKDIYSGFHYIDFVRRKEDIT